ncbi:hypothetical protein F5Y14DRAFT_403748 [Nemania sp. NC0429]|nr:hypothetical protein F5Y14DRAFT_403748 [Nemania sp. NC0429]
MKACAALPWRRVGTGPRKGRLPQWKHLYRHSSSERRRNDASPIVPESAATHARLDIDTDNKTIATAVGRLPLSPVMDPSYWEATTRHQRPKAKQGKAQNSVERQFRKNPFAMALATPIRQCTASRTRLPSFFLQDFNLISHPETGQPWWVPRSLLQDQTPNSQQASTPGDESSTKAQELDEQQADVGPGPKGSVAPEEDPSMETAAGDESGDANPYGPAAYVLARQDLIASFMERTSGYHLFSKRLFGGSSSRYAKFAPQAVWREDMDSFLLHQMREGIIKDLIYLSRLCTESSRYYIVKCYGWDDMQYKHEGAVLWFGDADEPNKVASAKVQPGLFSIYNITNDTKTASVAVHNIPMLLGAEGLAKVRQDATILADGSLFMLAGRRTAGLQMKLWRLQGYLADYRDGSEVKQLLT